MPAQAEHQSTEWKPEISLLTRRVLIDGSIAEPTDLVMRRKTKAGGYEYRRPTAAEVKEFDSFEAW